MLHTAISKLPDAFQKAAHRTVAVADGILSAGMATVTTIAGYTALFNSSGVAKTAGMVGTAILLPSAYRWGESAWRHWRASSAGANDNATSPTHYPLIEKLPEKWQTITHTAASTIDIAAGFGTGLMAFGGYAAAPDEVSVGRAAALSAVWLMAVTTFKLAESARDHILTADHIRDVRAFPGLVKR